MNSLREAAEKELVGHIQKCFETTTAIRDELRKLQGVTDFSELPDEELVQYNEFLKGSNANLPFLHINCIGADEQALEIARAIGYWIVAHPAKELDKYQLDIFTFASDEARNYKLPLRRNKDIVNETDYLIACPNEHSEPKPARGQGTWSTVRYARNCRYGYPFVIVWPDGTFV